jgi:hypothetical protein
VPNKYEHFDPAYEFTWTAAPGSNGHAPASTNGHAPAATNGHRTVTADASDQRALEAATGNVLLFAQRVADDTIADARREAERIIAEAHAAPPAPTSHEPALPDPALLATSAREAAELRERSEQLRIESRLRNLLMNDLVECVAELSSRVEREIGEAMQMLEHARERALADFSAINALARLAGLPTDGQPELQPNVAPRAATRDEQEFTPAPDSFVIDLRDALDDDRNTTMPDDFDELFARRGVYMESRETRRSRWTKSAGLFSTVLGHRAD